MVIVSVQFLYFPVLYYAVKIKKVLVVGPSSVHFFLIKAELVVTAVAMLFFMCKP